MRYGNFYQGGSTGAPSPQGASGRVSATNKYTVKSGINQSPQKEAWLGPRINSVEQGIGIDIDGDGKVGKGMISDGQGNFVPFTQGEYAKMENQAIRIASGIEGGSAPQVPPKSFTKEVTKMVEMPYVDTEITQVTTYERVVEPVTTSFPTKKWKSVPKTETITETEIEVVETVEKRKRMVWKLVEEEYDHVVKTPVAKPVTKNVETTEWVEYDDVTEATYYKEYLKPVVVQREDKVLKGKMVEVKQQEEWQMIPHYAGTTTQADVKNISKTETFGVQSYGKAMPHSVAGSVAQARLARRQ